jgi:hypothetical protein
VFVIDNVLVLGGCACLMVCTSIIPFLILVNLFELFD